MMSNLLSLFVQDVTLFQASDARGLAPWPETSWHVVVPAVFLGNVVVAILAWFIVGLIVNLM
jgi:hypothetical protein